MTVKRTLELVSPVASERPRRSPAGHSSFLPRRERTSGDAIEAFGVLGRTDGRPRGSCELRTTTLGRV